MKFCSWFQEKRQTNSVRGPFVFTRSEIQARKIHFNSDFLLCSEEFIVHLENKSGKMMPRFFQTAAF